MKYKYSDLFLYAIIGILIFLLLFQHCKGDRGEKPNTTTVTIPKIEGKFEPKEPKHVPVVGKVIKEKKGFKNHFPDVDGKDNDSLINELLKENEQLSRMYFLASDSLKKVMYDKSVQLNYFNDSFEDKNVKIDFSGIVRGEVKSIQPFYTIKERKEQIPIPQTKFRLLAGAGIGNNTEFSNPIFKANVGFQNKKGNIFRVSYDAQKNIYAEYDFSIFAIKK